MTQITDNMAAEKAFGRRDFHLMDKATFLSISKQRTEQAGFLWDNTSGERQSSLYDRLMQTVKGEGLGTLMAECKCRRCPLSDLSNGKWCKNGVEPAQCMREVK